MKKPASKRGPYHKHLVEEAEMQKKQVGVLTNRELLREVEDRGFFATKAPPQKVGKVFKGIIPRSDKVYRIGIVGDTQMGSKFQQLTHLHTFYNICRNKGVRTIFHAGDVVDGERMYRGQEYELFVHGADAQRDYVIENYPKISGIQTYMISGNHDASFWATSGYNVVQAICGAREDLTFLGDNYATYEMGKIKIAVMHGEGGVAYARSYKLQKLIEQISPENKPHMLFLGHFHVEDIQPMYRNVVGIQLPCFQAQTPYLARKGLYPELGGWIVEFGTNEKGLAYVRYENYPFYVPKKNDY